MRLLLSLQSAQRHPRCVAGLQPAVVLLFNVVRKLVHQVRNQAGLHRLLAMAQRLLHLCCKPLRVELPADPQRVCAQRDPVLDDLLVLELAERRSHRQLYVSSRSWAICSSADQST